MFDDSLDPKLCQKIDEDKQIESDRPIKAICNCLVRMMPTRRENKVGEGDGEVVPYSTTLVPNIDSLLQRMGTFFPS